MFIFILTALGFWAGYKMFDGPEEENHDSW